MTGRILAGATVALGLWTVAAHLCVLAGGGLVHVLFVFAVLAGVAIAIVRRLPALLALDEETAGPLDPRVVLGTALGAAGLAWVLRGPNPDDMVYVNLAVTAADHPTTPLTRVDGLFGFDTPSAMLRPYFLHSVELVAAAGRLLTGVPAIVFLHAVLPVFAAILVTLAQFELGRRLLPSRPHTVAIGALVFLLLVSDGWQSHGSHGFESFTMGRALLVNGLLPLILVATVRVHSSPAPAATLFLALTLFAAVGASSNALVLGPACAWSAHVGIAGRRAFRDRRAVGVLAATMPIVLLAAWAYGYRTDLHPPAPVDGTAAMREVVERAFGAWPLVVATGLGVVAGLAAIPRGPYRRALLCTALVLLVLTANPWTPGWANQVIVREGMLPRAWLVLPIPALVAAGAAFVLARTRTPDRVSGPATVTLLAVVFAALPGRGPLKAARDPAWTRTLNVYPAQYRLARDLAAVTDPQDVVLVSPWNSMYVPAMHDHPRLFYARELYEGYLADRLGTDEAARRRRLALFVDASPRVDDFTPACEDFDGIDVVVAGRRAERARRVLRDCGWTLDPSDDRGRIWVRAPRP